MLYYLLWSFWLIVGVPWHFQPGLLNHSQKTSTNWSLQWQEVIVYAVKKFIVFIVFSVDPPEYHLNFMPTVKSSNLHHVYKHCDDVCLHLWHMQGQKPVERNPIFFCHPQSTRILVWQKGHSWIYFASEDWDRQKTESEYRSKPPY